MNFTYDPYEFAINMDMNMNENSVYSNMMSAKNPPPLCMPVPVGPLPIGLEMCIKVFNIWTPQPGYNLHMCMDVMARIQSAPLMILHFDCMRMGQEGTVLLKPEDEGGLMPPFEEIQGEEQMMVVYDEVEAIKKANLTNDLL